MSTTDNGTVDLGGQPAGWYPDPWQQSPFRWWDGYAWTPHLWQQQPVTPVLDETKPARQAQLAIAAAAVAAVFGTIVGHPALVDLVEQLRDLSSTSDSFLMLNNPLYLASWLSSLVSMAAGIVFLIWFHRSATNAVAMGLRARRDPTMGVLGFMIPIINLWWPYGSMRDLFPEDDPRRAHVLPWFLLWAPGGIVAVMVSYVAAIIGGSVGWALLVVPVVQVCLAGLLVWRLIDQVVDAHTARVDG